MPLGSSEARRLAAIWRQYGPAVRNVSQQTLPNAPTHHSRQVLIIGPICHPLSVSRSFHAGCDNGYGVEKGVVTTLASQDETLASPSLPKRLVPGPASDNVSRDATNQEDNELNRKFNESDIKIKRDESCSKRERSIIAGLEKGKEDKSVINQLLLNSRHPPFDWRIPLRLLEEPPVVPKAIHVHTSSEKPELTVLKSNDSIPGDATPRRRVDSKPLPKPLANRVQTRNRMNVKFARDVPKPSVWSPSILVGYIEDLIEFEYCKNKVPYIPPTPNAISTNLDDAVTAIGKVFRSQETQGSLTIEAFVVALRFYLDRNLLPEARSLFLRLEDSRVNIPVEIFNFLLRSTARSKDLHNFTFFLDRGIKRGIKPDIETWNAFLMTIPWEEVKAVVIHRMRETKVLDKTQLERGVVRIIAQHEFAYLIEQCGDRAVLLDHLADRYGEDWLTTSTGNKLLVEYRKRKSLQDTLALLVHLKTHGFEPDEVSQDSLLRHSLLLRKPWDAIQILHIFDYCYGIRPGRSAYETLFRLACKSQLLNVARMVWALARSCGHVTSQMRLRVSQGSTSKVDRDSITTRFNALLPYFIRRIKKKHILDDLVPNSPSGSNDLRSEKPLSRREYRNMILISKSLDRPQMFPKVLREALTLDQKWAREKFVRKDNFPQVIEAGLQHDEAIVEKLDLGSPSLRYCRSEDLIRRHSRRRYLSHKLSKRKAKSFITTNLRKVESRRVPVHRVRKIVPRTPLRVPAHRVRKIVPRTCLRIVETEFMSKRVLIHRVRNALPRTRLRRVETDSFTIRRLITERSEAVVKLLKRRARRRRSLAKHFERRAQRRRSLARHIKRRAQLRRQQRIKAQSLDRSLARHIELARSIVQKPNVLENAASSAHPVILNQCRSFVSLTLPKVYSSSDRTTPHHGSQELAAVDSNSLESGHVSDVTPSSQPHAASQDNAPQTTPLRRPLIHKYRKKLIRSNYVKESRWSPDLPIGTQSPPSQISDSDKASPSDPPQSHSSVPATPKASSDSATRKRFGTEEIKEKPLSESAQRPLQTESSSPPLSTPLEDLIGKFVTKGPPLNNYTDHLQQLQIRYPQKTPHPLSASSSSPPISRPVGNLVIRKLAKGDAPPLNDDNSDEPQQLRIREAKTTDLDSWPPSVPQMKKIPIRKFVYKKAPQQLRIRRSRTRQIKIAETAKVFTDERKESARLHQSLDDVMDLLKKSEKSTGKKGR